MECGFDTHKNALINNLVILFDFFCAVESIYSFFQTDRFFWFNLNSIDTFSLSRTVFKIFDFKVFRVWPWPLTFRGHPRSKIFSPFGSPYMTSYLTSVDTFFLSRTVFEIFDFKVFRVLSWPLTLRGDPRSRIFSPFESHIWLPI